MEGYRNSMKPKADLEFVVGTLNNSIFRPNASSRGNLSSTSGVLQELQSRSCCSMHLVLCIIIVDGSHTNMSGIISVLVDEEGRVINNSWRTRIWYSAEWQTPKHVQKRVAFKSQPIDEIARVKSCMGIEPPTCCPQCEGHIHCAIKLRRPLSSGVWQISVPARSFGLTSSQRWNMLSMKY